MTTVATRRRRREFPAAAVRRHRRDGYNSRAVVNHGTLVTITKRVLFTVFVSITSPLFARARYALPTYPTCEQDVFRRYRARTSRSWLLVADTEIFSVTAPVTVAIPYYVIIFVRRRSSLSDVLLSLKLSVVRLFSLRSRLWRSLVGVCSHVLFFYCAVVHCRFTRSPSIRTQSRDFRFHFADIYRKYFFVRYNFIFH